MCSCFEFSNRHIRSCSLRLQWIHTGVRYALIAVGPALREAGHGWSWSLVTSTSHWSSGNPSHDQASSRVAQSWSLLWIPRASETHTVLTRERLSGDKFIVKLYLQHRDIDINRDCRHKSIVYTVAVTLVVVLISYSHVGVPHIEWKLTVCRLLLMRAEKKSRLWGTK